MSLESHHDHFEQPSTETAEVAGTENLNPITQQVQKLIEKAPLSGAPYEGTKEFDQFAKFCELYVEQIKQYNRTKDLFENLVKYNPFISFWLNFVPEIPKETQDANDFLERWNEARKLLESYGVKHERPPFDIESVKVGEKTTEIVEEAVHVTAFGTLLHFKKNFKEGNETIPNQPKVLIAAPLSGHFATLLRNTVETMLPDHDVYITDWHNARDIPASEGYLGVDAYVDSLIAFVENIGPGTNIVSVCQSGPATLIAASVLKEHESPATPRSLTLMASPIDTRISPTVVDELATKNPLDWFAKNVIAKIPEGLPGEGRLVYSGFTQLSAFVSMKPAEHKAKLDKLKELQNSGQGDSEEAQKIKSFYDEFFTAIDLSAEFYLETLKLFFQDHALQNGYTHHGKEVDFQNLVDMEILAVEGEKDDICGIGQTEAALSLTGKKPTPKNYHVQKGAGHLGVFSGHRWEEGIYPLIRAMIAEAATK